MGNEESIAASRATDSEEVKVIHTVPSAEIYPRDRYPYSPLRLVPVSKFSDIGRYFDWIEAQKMVSFSLHLTV